jgi:peptidoglycan/LPS O-acetylase OafA/YrhL
VERRLGYIDGLRAVAVLSVIAFHVRVHTAGVRLEHLFKEGAHGVDLFFVLSGLCLALPTLERVRKTGSANFDVAGYALKRCLRILPPYVAAVFLFAGVVWFFLSHGLALPEGMHRFDATDLLSELFFLDRNNLHINQSFWSLALEFRWYFVFPLALALWVARPRALLLAIALVVIAAECTRASSADLGVLDAFLLGIVAAHIRVNSHPIARYGIAFVLGGAILGLALEPSYHFPIQTNSGWHLAAFGLVIYAGHAVWLQRILASRMLRAVGIASYSIYLVHEPIVSFFAARATPATIVGRVRRRSRLGAPRRRRAVVAGRTPVDRARVSAARGGRRTRRVGQRPRTLARSRRSATARRLAARTRARNRRRGRPSRSGREARRGFRRRPLEPSPACHWDCAD